MLLFFCVNGAGIRFTALVQGVTARPVNSNWESQSLCGSVSLWKTEVNITNILKSTCLHPICKTGTLGRESLPKSYCRFLRAGKCFNAALMLPWTGKFIISLPDIVMLCNWDVSWAEEQNNRVCLRLCWAGCGGGVTWLHYFHFKSSLSQ